MKPYAVPFILAFLLAGSVSCQTKSVRTVFSSTQIDTATGLKEQKIYLLKKQTTNSDFDYSKLNNIDHNIEGHRNIENLIPIFEPIGGQFNYFRFIATFKDEAYNGGDGPILIKDSHDILILKTNNENKIIDAYQYTLEWAEPPSNYDLFKSSAKNLALTDNLDISTLKFIRTGNLYKGEILNESGKVKLKQK